MRDLEIKEEKAIDLTVKLWASLQALKIIHSRDLVEMQVSIHDIQARIMSRPFRENK